MLAISAILVLGLAVPSYEQAATLPPSPCPNVFSYENQSSEQNRWYGVVNLSTDSTLHSLWLNIELDSKADILGNWIGDVSTSDNKNFKIENTKLKIEPGPATPVRFFIQYNQLQDSIPTLYSIKLNGREICSANNPLPAVVRPINSGTTKPIGSRTTDTPTQTQRPEVPIYQRPTNQGSTGTIQIADQGLNLGTVQRPRPADRPINGPVYVPTPNPPINESGVNTYSIGSGHSPQNSVQQRPDYRFTTSPPHNIKRHDDDFDSDSNSDPSEYFAGGQPTILVPGGGNRRPTQTTQSDGACGKVRKNNPNPLVVNGKPTLEGQWPWQIALYQTQTIDNKYICGGTLISRRHVITAAHCVTKKDSRRIVNPNTLTIYLGKHNLRTSVEGVQIEFVREIIVHPDYNATSFARDVAILVLREPVRYSDWVQPACLWPANQVELTNVIGKKGSVVGWGFDDKGLPTEELTLVEMPVVKQETCTWSYSEFFAKFTSDFTYCAGYRDGTSVCNGDSGGGMVFNMDNTWYLRGLVSLSVARKNDYEYRCDPTHYVVFTDLAKFLPWIQDTIREGGSSSNSQRYETNRNKDPPVPLYRNW